jgi:hypothetical protein
VAEAESELRFRVEFEQSVGEDDFNAAVGGVDEGADIFCEGDEEFAAGSVHGEEGSGAGEFDVADGAEGGAGVGAFEDRATGEVADVVLALGERSALGERELDFEVAEFFGVVHGVAAFEMKDDAVAVEPGAAQAGFARLALAGGKKNFAEFEEAFGKVGEDLRGDFALDAAGAENSREGHVGIGGGRHGGGAIREFRGSSVFWP